MPKPKIKLTNKCIREAGSLKNMKCASLRLIPGPEVASDGQLMDNISTGLFQHSSTYFLFLFCFEFLVFLDDISWYCIKQGEKESAGGLDSKHTMEKSSPSAMIVFIHCWKNRQSENAHYEKTHEQEFWYLRRVSRCVWFCLQHTVDKSNGIIANTDYKGQANLRNTFMNVFFSEVSQQITFPGRRKEGAGVCVSLLEIYQLQSLYPFIVKSGPSWDAHYENTHYTLHITHNRRSRCRQT